jgi:hypothetical protein
LTVAGAAQIGDDHGLVELGAELIQSTGEGE